ncbi:hypothetical protein RIF29_34285 [Crotalaria pallida]|uniref:BAG family molecular chaperone regulator 1 n=1 Tax=Crotalaria pallida TaxID=3830 RepID=A0AAN9EEN6_CROPI
MFSRAKKSDIGAPGTPNVVAEWELRPGGMLVQKRGNNYVNQNSAHDSTIKVRVKYGSSYHEIRISSHASFGELKKMLTGATGLHAQDQKLIFKKKERDSKSYLDVERVKNGSKLVLLEDIESRERRILEAMKISMKEKTSKSLKEMDVEVDKLTKKVAALEVAASAGNVIEVLDVESLTENLMRILIRLDEISAEGELKKQRREQVKNVQKHIETLDMLKMPNPKSIPQKSEENIQTKNKVHCGVEKQHIELVEQSHKKLQQPIKHSDSVVVTTKWETFD